MTRRSAALAAALASALVLAGCGGVDATAQQPPAPVAAPVAAPVVAPAENTDGSAITPAESTARGTGQEGHDATSHAAATAALPDVQVVRVTKGGETVNLQSLHTAGKATLLWFWAPHCPFCKAEAPKLLDFNAKHGDKVAVLGLGAQDDLDQAEGFCNETRTTPLEMVWDASGKSWLHYKVTNQPTVILIDKDGKVVKRWFRNFDEQGILAAAGAA